MRKLRLLLLALLASLALSALPAGTSHAASCSNDPGWARPRAVQLHNARYNDQATWSTSYIQSCSSIAQSGGYPIPPKLPGGPGRYCWLNSTAIYVPVHVYGNVSPRPDHKLVKSDEVIYIDGGAGTGVPLFEPTCGPDTITYLGGDWLF
jgi:hypothetical protein